MILKRIFLAAFIATVFVEGIVAQRLFPVSGGTGVEESPNKKGSAAIVAETETVKILLDNNERQTDFSMGKILTFWLRISNKSQKPLAIDPTKFSAVESGGRTLSVLEPKDALERVMGGSAFLRTAIWGGSMSNAGEKGFMSRYLNKSLQLGDIPSGAYKEGLVYLEKGNDKDKVDSIKFSLGTLWPDSFEFSLSDGRKVKLTKSK
ncbi:MAG: hypothetical protein ABL999_19475 [Pyrinomonadaceae bacterium]